jgi:hypothetical protein
MVSSTMYEPLRAEGVESTSFTHETRCVWTETACLSSYKYAVTCYRNVYIEPGWLCFAKRKYHAPCLYCDFQNRVVVQVMGGLGIPYPAHSRILCQTPSISVKDFRLSKWRD